MANFKELLDAPLPSQEDDFDEVFGESAEDDDIFTDDELDEFFGESEEDDDEDEFEESEDDDEDFDDIFGESEDEFDDIFGESDDDFEESDDEDMDESDDIGEAEEGTDPDEEDDSDDSNYADEGCGEEGCDTEEGFDDFDDDRIADEIEDIMDDDPDYPDDDELDDVDDLDLDDIPDEKPEPLTGEEDKKADDMMAIAATPLLIKDELTAESAAEFYESEEGEIAISEGLILESDMEDLFQEGVFASPNKPFKMTKKARFNQLYEISVQIEGRLRNDPYYAKLQKAYAVERICKRELRKRYHQFAVKRAKVYLQRLIKSKSGTLAKIGKKIGLKK